MTGKSIYRCAVYTRKSHEDGLDQEFNSLDAQSEACKAYITSQTGLGWKLREQQYDDGGISGGHMDRPGLQAMIADIKAGLIDVIVVYKVDRLTRSLTDFAKLVDVFDAHDVSFVSVTQAFNTTTSMGRLTLNVLLSFAQFEREVTAERIRDKFAASKKKGIWMGGTCPLGYRHEDRKLYIREGEAKIIKRLYHLYIDHKNVRSVKAEADTQGFTTRLRKRKSGEVVGGKPFSRGHIYRILTNPIYRGMIQHKDKIYEGEHEAIIHQDVWDQVQSILKTNAVNRKTIGNSKSNMLLAGLLYDDQGNRLVPHHANKKGRRYHYYVSQRLKTGDQDSGWRLPAAKIEGVVRSVLASSFGTREELLKLLPVQALSADKLQKLIKTGKEVSDQIKADDHSAIKSLFNNMIDSIELAVDNITFTFKPSYISEIFGLNIAVETSVTLTKSMTIKRSGQEMKLIIDGLQPNEANKNQALIKLVSQAYALRMGLESGTVNSIKEFADQNGIDHADAKRMFPISYLAPDIVESILDGRQPEELSALTLKDGYSLPILWSEQRAKLGFPVHN